MSPDPTQEFGTNVDRTSLPDTLMSADSRNGNQYFGGVRRSFMNALPPNPKARLLEMGCGSGSTAALAGTQGKCGWCCGVELCEEPPAQARTQLDKVNVGDIEQLELDLPPSSFDVLLMSEVWEHVRDPGAVLRKLRPLLRSGAIVLAGSPNVCHYSILLMLLRGRRDYQREGIMDETHLRWFTAASYRRLFEASGYVVDNVGPAQPLRPTARLANSWLVGRFEHLFYSQIVLKAHYR